MNRRAEGVTRPLLKTGGQQALLSVEVLKNCLDELQNLENIAARDPDFREFVTERHVCVFRLFCVPFVFKNQPTCRSGTGGVIHV